MLETTVTAYYEQHAPCVAQIVLVRSQKILVFLLVLATICLFVSDALCPGDVFPDEYLLFYVVTLAFLLNVGPCHRMIAVLARKECNGPTCLPAELSEVSLPRYTVLCPLYRESCTVGDLISNLSRLSYPRSKLEVFLLVEESDSETLQALPDKMEDYISVVRIPGRTARGKPFALNVGLTVARGDFLTVYDAEDNPDPMQLRAAVAAFEFYGADVWAVQAKLRYSNATDNWLTTMFFAEYCHWFEVYLPFLMRRRYPVPLGGTSNHIRVDKLKQIGGWDPFNVTEDADLTLRIYKEGGQTALFDSVTTERSPARMHTWIRQRTRWIKGLIQTVLVHTRDRFWLCVLRYFVVCFGGIVSVILCMCQCVSAMVSFNNRYHDNILVIAVMSLICAISAHCIIYYAGLRIGGYHRLWPRVLCPGILVYWLLYLTANARAIFQICVDPFHWEKTDHSLGS